MGFIDKYMPVPPERIRDTKFCFLIKGGKGKPVEGEEDSFIAQSPLIRGYKNDGHYAHSFYFPNENNKSGKGRLGKGWEAFNVWEEMGVKTWIEMLSSKVRDSQTGEDMFEIQPECGDIIKQQVVTPPETFVKDADLFHTLVQIEAMENIVNKAIKTEQTRG